ncbi:Obg-like ATPase 1 [Hondaea fermentalgiana]|uniref:Obg-like ATPase 1 n=1 Tax=Hondaea fermentalgiana TaxID=2315210 RepID=A0A2R5G5D4_9STRA|nr:Obg-like ATPase 1 [Hondaea fermentalgiana]|eukprot:GBG26190.1 Obg-like ATPase 1 [Hondaea fermentalgiana]
MAGVRAACGIVGLPNVGKSTLCNALSRSEVALASNFPFCTIEPNVARVAVPDPRLARLAALAKSERVVPQMLELHDIAGLIKGASEGEGLGNKFLANIRSVSMIVHVLRCFHNVDILHVSADERGITNPVDDLEVVETELMLADLASVEKRLQKKKMSPGDKILLEEVRDCLAEGRPARDVLKGKGPDAGESVEAGKGLTLRQELQQQLLSFKPVLPVCNVDEDTVREGRNEMTDMVKEVFGGRGGVEPVVLCASLEEEALSLSPEERDEYFAEFGLRETGLDKVASGAAKLLDLDVFYTVGPAEAHAWSIPVGATAQEAAGKIHTDMSRGFIAADTIAYDDFVNLGGEKQAKDAGKLRSEGRDYIVQSGDIMNFKFNV